MLLGLSLFYHISAVTSEREKMESADDILSKYKAMLKNAHEEQAAQKEEIPDHTGNPIWLRRWVCVNRLIYMAQELKGQVGYVSGFEEANGRYLVDFEKGVGERKQYALHPINLQPVDSKDSRCEEKQPPPATEKDHSDQGKAKRKKDEL